jgi:hypothetical protein
VVVPEQRVLDAVALDDCAFRQRDDCRRGVVSR